MIKKAKKILLEPQTEKVKKTKIRVIGIGGGGGNIVSEIAPRIKKATFVAANTHLRALKEVSRKVERFPFGQNLTQGLGTGMNPELGELAAQNEREKIKNLFKNQDLVILIACLGGGTSSGATPIFAKIAKSVGGLSYGIFTLPFNFEGKKKMEMARISLEKLKPKLNALSIIPNERIFQTIDKATPLKDALSAINKALAESLEGLLEVIYRPGLINIDFADLKTILQGRGRLAYLNCAKVEKKAGVKRCIEKTINSPLYPYSIGGAKGVLYNIAGEKNLNLEEVSQISKTISELSNPKAKIIFGISQSKKYQDVIKTTLLATGLSAKIFLPKPKRLRPTHHPLTRPPALKMVPQIEKKEVPKEKEITPPQKPISELKVKKIKKIKKSEPKKLKPIRPKRVRKKKIEVVPVPEEMPQTESPKEIQRKNALQIKKEAEEAEREIVEKEKFWETPAFLRKKIS